VLVLLFFSVVLHEVSHGYVAYLNGDRTALAAGRLTLNPLAHIDLLGTVLIPLVLVLTRSPFLIGWAKPVPFDSRNFKNEKWGILTVALAGPLTNILIACVFAALLRVTAPRQASAEIYYYGLSINLLLALFNLFPLPPLDGSKALSVFLPARLRRKFLSMDFLGFVVLFILLYTGIIHRLLLPAYQKLLDGFIGGPGAGGGGI